MGIIDLLAEKAEAAQAAPVVPAAIPLGTPTPAVTPAEIQADKADRQAAAALAKQDPEAAMAGATIIPSPPKKKFVEGFMPTVEPAVIPLGTPTPAVSPGEIAADREARREAAEAMRAGLAGGAPAEAPAAPAAPAVAPVTTATAEIPLIAQQAQATTAIPEEAVAPAQAMPAVDVEPTFQQKLGSIAKRRGRGILDALQAGLYNFAGITKPTDYEKRVEAEAAEQKDLLDKQWQMQLAKIQQDFQANQAVMDRDFSLAVAKAKNDWDVQAAKDAYARQKQENALDRQSAMNIATAQHQQGTAAAVGDARDKFGKLIQSRYGGQ